MMQKYNPATKELDLVSYAELARDFKPQDILNFQGTKFELVRFLGSGNTTAIYELKDGTALRIPVSGADRGFSCSFLRGAHELRGTRIRAVKVHFERSAANCQFIVVDKINALFTLKDLFDAKRFKKEIPMGFDRDFLVQKFFDFSFSTIEFSFLTPDFRSDQLVFDGDEWILVDWTDGFEKVKNPYSPIPIAELGHYNFFTIEEMKRLTSEIIEKRKELLKDTLKVRNDSRDCLKIFVKPVDDSDSIRT